MNDGTKYLTEKEVDDKIQKAVFVVSQTVSDLFKDMKAELKEDLILAVENKIETKVNGKIKAIDTKMDQQNIVLGEQTTKIDELKPILQRHKDGQSTIRYLAPYFKSFVTFVGLVGAWYIFRDFISNLFSK